MQARTVLIGFLLFLATIVSSWAQQCSRQCPLWDEDIGSIILSGNDDGSVGPIQLPFPVPVYGNTYTQFWINNNGNVTFTGPLSTYTAFAFPNNRGIVIVAPFFADVDTRPAASGKVHYKATNDYVVITWNNVGYYNNRTDKLNRFQLIITRDGYAGFSYANMEWTTGDASGGSGGFGGSPARAGFDAGNGRDALVFWEGNTQQSLQLLCCRTFWYNLRTGLPTEDRYPPDTIIVEGPEEGALVCREPVRFRWTGTDDATAPQDLYFRWRLDGGDWSNWSRNTSVNLTGLSDGEHTFEVQARDLAERIDETPATRTFRFRNDPNPPQISNVRVDAQVDRAVIQWTTDEPSTSQVEYRLQGASSWQRTNLDTNLVTEHTVTITGLQGHQTYEYRVLSRDECGNEAVSGIGTFIVRAADLRPIALQLPSEFWHRIPFEVSWQIKNEGTLVASDWIDRLYFSRDDQLDSSDRFVGDYGYAGLLEPGQSVTRAQNITIPRAWIDEEGTYYIIVVVDATNRVDEGVREENNTLARSFTARDTIPPTVSITRAPAEGALVCTLPVEFAWQGSDDYTPADQLQYRYRVNGGAWTAWSNETQVSLTNLPQGVAVFEVQARDRRENESQVARRSFRVDTQPPVITALRTENLRPISVEVVFATDERSTSRVEYKRSDETEWRSVNASTTLRTTHRALLANLQADSEYQYRAIVRDECGHENVSSTQTFRTPAGADLVVSAANAPTQATANTPFNFSWTVRNQGALRASQAWIDRVYLSQDSTLGNDDRLLAERGYNAGLDAGREVARNAAIVIPADVATGDYYLIVFTDALNAVSETDESNNTRAVAVRVQAVDNPPDTEITEGPDEGGIACSLPIIIRWRGSDAETPADQLQFSYRLDNQPWSDWTNDTEITLNELSDGAHVFMVRARDGAGQADATPAIRRFYVGVNPPQISSPRAQVQQASVVISWGTNIPATSQVEYGTTPALGQSSPQDSQLKQNHSVVLRGLQPNTTYYYRVKSVSACGVESVSELFTFRTGNIPDLTIEPVQIPNEMGTWQTYIFQWRVHNNGQGDAVGEWFDGFYLSSDEQLDANDRLIRWVRRPANLRSGTNYLNAAELRIPTIEPGAYYVILIVDPRNAIHESDENNNVAVYGPVQIVRTDAPVIAEIDDATAEEGVAYRGPTPQLIQGTPPIRWSLQSGPPGMVIDSNGQVSWARPVGNVQPYAITIKAENAAGSDTETWLLTVAPTYRAEAQTDAEVVVAGTPVTITGRAISLATGQPRPNSPVKVRLRIRGLERTLDAVTNAQGEFRVIYVSLPREAGQVELCATHPGDNRFEAQDRFTLIAMYYEPERTQHDLIPFTDYEFTTVLRNAGDTPLGGIQYEILNQPTELFAQVQGPSTLEGLGAGEVRLRVRAETQRDLRGTLVVRAYNAQGVQAQWALQLSIRAPRPVLTITPNQLKAAMLRGDQTLVSFTVRNDGGAPTDPMRVALPNAPWLNLTTNEVIPPLAPGAEAVVTLQLTPAPDLPLGPYNGTIVVGQGLYYGVAVPFRFNCVSNRKGDLAVRVEDEATYWGLDGNENPNRPLVRNAIVQLRHPETNVLLYEAVTESENEPLLIRDLTEGYYTLVVQAPQHATYRQTWLVEGDRVTEVRAFIPREVIRYRWSVRPTDIPDVTIITLEAVFETYVPQPVVTVNPPLVDLSQIEESAQIDFVVENQGLVKAENVELELPSHPNWRFTLLTDQIGDLQPRERRVVPVLVERVEDGGSLSNPPCTIVSGVRWELVCFDRKYYRVPIVWVKAYGNCIGGITGWGGGASGGIGGGGGGWGSGGGTGGGAGNPYFYPPSFEPPQECEPCDPANFEPSQLACSRVDIGQLTGHALNAMITALTQGWVGVESNDTETFAQLCLQTCCNSDGSIGIAGRASAGFSIPLKLNRTSVSVDLSNIDLEPIEVDLPDIGLCRVELNLSGNAEIGVMVSGNLSGSASYTRGCDVGCENNVPTLQAQGNASLTITGGGRAQVEGTASLQCLGTQIRSVQVTGTATAVVQTGASLGFTYDDCKGLRLLRCFEGIFAEFELSLKLRYRLGNEEQEVVLGIPCTRYYFVCPVGNNDDCAPPNDCTNFGCGDYFGQGGLMMDIGDLSGQIEQALRSSLSPYLYRYKMTPVSNMERYLVGEDGDFQPADGEEGVCARVRVQLQQQVVLSRQAFNAELEIANPSDAENVSGVLAFFDIYDAEGNLASDKFAIYPPTLRNINAIDGTGVIAPDTIATINWIIVPRKTAAPQETTRYYVSGVLVYTVAGTTYTVPLLPAPIDVQPDPTLELDYFWQRDVFADDPFTPEVEPSEPFSLGLRMMNTGFGTARNVRVISGQPRIVENERNLPIEFRIIGSQVNDQPITPSLTVNLGDLPPQSTAVARWLMISNFQGRFVGFNATYRHVNPLNDDSLSLIDRVDIHELDHVVRILHPQDDRKPDFLVNATPDPQYLPDVVFNSTGEVHPVQARLDGTVDGPINNARLQTRLTVSNPPQGFVYIRIPDPSGGQHPLLRVVRSDGREILMESNAWTTHRVRRPAGGSPYREDLVHIFDHDSTGVYTLIYGYRHPVNVDAGETKLQRDGVEVRMGGTTGLVVTAVFPDSIYVQSHDRSAGIRVTNVRAREGDWLRIRGTLLTAENGERYVEARETVKVGEGMLDPLGMTIRTLYCGDFHFNPATGEGQRGMAGGAGLNVIGLLVQVSGVVSSTATDHFLMVDGDGRAVKVWLTPGMVAPPAGALARVTGIVSPQRIGNDLYPTIRVRRPEDVQAPLEPLPIHSPATVIRSGWNQFTLGGVPANPNPLSVLSNFDTGDGLANRLRRFEPLSQQWLTWDPNAPQRFGGLLVGEGYQLQSANSLPIQFEGVPFNAIDIWLSLPRQGYTVVGHPFDAPVPWETVKVVDGLQALNMFTAARVQSPPWLDSRATYFDNLSQTSRTMGLPTDNPDSVLMEPWLGYRVETFRDQLALIVSNRAPVAVDDEAATEIGTPVEVLVLENDRSPVNRSLSIVGWTQGQHGTVSQLSESVLVYTPNSGYAGLDSFTYTIADSDGFRATATVYICVGRVTLTGIVRLNTPVYDLNTRLISVQVGRAPVQQVTLQGSGREGTFTLRVPAFGEYVVKVKPHGALQQTRTVRPEGIDLTVRFDGAGAGLPLGDANGDNFIDDADLLEVLFQFGQTGSNLSGDLDGSGVVDDADLLIVLFNFGLYGNP